jgi:TetR/AcrR family transcriptional repressor of lmrAB and yxaGH operons
VPRRRHAHRRHDEPDRVRAPRPPATLEGDRSPRARDAAAAAFERWEEILTTAFTRHVAADDRARSLATTSIAAIEGEVVLARATRSVEPLERVAAELERLIETAAAG